MSLSIGIIGLPKSGKTTVFNALTGGSALSDGSHIGVARVPEARLVTLTGLLNPKRVVPAEVKYIDVGAQAKISEKETGISGQLLGLLSATDELINVVRAFPDESIPHPEGSLDVRRDIAGENMELAFSDLAILERRLERIEASLKGAKAAERPAILKEQALLIKIKGSLGKDIPLREQNLALEESKAITSYQFLTAKPLLIVVNIGESQLGQAAALEAELGARFNRPDQRLITLCGKLEMELAQLDEAAAASFRAEFGLAQAGLERTIKLSYGLLGLISFFTIASGEVRAWSIKGRSTAVEAAGKIHTDMARGFIRAEVISLADLVSCGSLTEARKKGLLRLEGKGYVVQDGDVITFLFNV